MSRLDANLSAKTIDVAKLVIAKPAASKRAGSAPTSTKPLFTDDPLPFDAIPLMELNVDIAVGRIEMRGLPPLSALRARLASVPGRVSVDPARFGVAGGALNGRAALSVAANSQPRVELMVDAKSISVDVLDAALTGQRHFNGGKANLLATLSATGSTAKRIAASGGGNMLLSVRDLEIVGSAAAAFDRNVVMTTLGAMMPKGGADRSLVIQCAVVRLPFQSGVARIDRSIALETSETSVVASGDVNFADQTLALSFVAKVKRGLGLNSASLAGLISVHGPLQEPHVGIDAKGTLRQATVVGAAVATGGLSLLLPLIRGAATDTSACEQAARPGKTTPVKIPSARPGKPPTPEG